MSRTQARPEPGPGDGALLDALILDVDGVVSPVHGHTAWGDDQVAGSLFGPVYVSPSMCARLEAVASRPGVSSWWLTSWDQQTRDSMDPFVGRSWPALATATTAAGEGWWKWDAVQAWLDQGNVSRRLVWCDDHLSPPARRDTIRQRLHDRGVDTLLIAPDTSVGLTPQHLEEIEAHLSTAL